MHIPDGFLDAKTWGTAWALGGGTTGYALYAARNKLDEKKIPLLGITAAFIFAAQMLNFPVAGGTSGHFLGAMLAFLLVGMWPGFLVIAVVLIVQCLFFADGGLTALGANILNMAAIGGLIPYGIFLLTNGRLAKLLGDKTSFLTTTAICSWLSVMLASGACAIELAISGTIPFGTVMPAMLGVHAIIGVGEAIITTVVMAVLLQTRPDLVDAYKYEVLQPALEVS